MEQYPVVQDSMPYVDPGALTRLTIPLVVLLMVVGAGVMTLGSSGLDVVATILLGATTLLAGFAFSRAAVNEPLGAALFQILMFAWLVKLGSLALKLFIAYSVYGGSADAFGYHLAGVTVSELLASGQLPDLSRFWGTQFIENVTGVMYLFTTPTFIGGWIVFAFLGTMGALLQYKAFVTAVPEGNRRWYMVLILFAPSVVIWTDSLGKDAIMAFFLGVTAYGAARISRWGLGLGSMIIVGIGAAGVFLVRPHIAAIVAVAMAAVVVLRPIRAGIFTPLIRIGTLAGIAALAFFVIQTSASFIGVEDLSVEGVEGFVGVQQESSATGGSSFESTAFPTNPKDFALGVVTVLFRPFPWEAGTTLAKVVAVEGLLLLALLLWRFRSVLRAFASVRRNAYVAFTIVYAAIFIFFFSGISNFGILVRQRVQVLPFIFVWLAFLGAARRDEKTFDR